ncbi:MAG: ETC complex I subunit [Hyphomicrobiales bacterium]|nr:ETC complex I subunit [Hyphomicrobiales bacterium]
MSARIYKPGKSATQSGARGRADQWLLVFAPQSPRSIDPLMGWTSSGDMKSQIRLSFPTREEAVAYAERNGIPFNVEEPPPRAAPRQVSYSDNFRPGRIAPWTH